MQTTNRRESPRIEIRLRCHITSPGVWAREEVHTENISRNGVLIVWRGGSGEEAAPALGQILTLEIELPAHHGFGPKCIHCQGTVTRVTRPAPESVIVALRVNYMDFRSFHNHLRSIQSMQPVASTWMA